MVAANMLTRKFDCYVVVVDAAHATCRVAVHLRSMGATVMTKTVCLIDVAVTATATVGDFVMAIVVTYAQSRR
jgi:hypothetical protein